MTDRSVMGSDASNEDSPSSEWATIERVLMIRLSLLSLPLLMAAAFLVGHATSPSVASAKTSAHVYTGRFGDVFRVPAAATRCLVSAEAGAANVHCAHMPIARARYEVVFYKNNLFVYRYGHPDNPVFSARGKP